jgi:hypothetical protein
MGHGVGLAVVLSRLLSLSLSLPNIPFQRISRFFRENPIPVLNPDPKDPVAPQILIVLFLIYLFDNIIQLISLRSLWYYGGW